MSGSADIAVGLGWSTSATGNELRTAITDTLRAAGIDDSQVCCVATIDQKDAIMLNDASAWPIRTFSAEELAGVQVPSPSVRVVNETGTASVAEASALLAAGEGAALVVAKQRIGRVTVALARSNP